MSEVKKKLFDIINTTFGNNSSQVLTLENLNKNAYSPKNNYKEMDLSFERLRHGTNSRKNSLSSINFSPQNKNRYSSPRKFETSQDKFHNLELIVPSNETPLYFSKYSTEKIKREIAQVKKLLTSDDIRPNYRNRPPVDLNKPHMEFSSRTYYAMSPTSTRKPFLTTSNVFKNTSKKTHIFNFDDYLGKYNFSHKENDFEIFAKELSPKKKNISVFERFPLNWRFKGSFN